MKITDEALQAALLSMARDNIGTDVQGLLVHGFDKLNAKPNALRNALISALPHMQPVDVAAARRQALEEALTRLFDLANNAREKARRFHVKQHDGKYGDRKKQRFYEEKKHFNRLAIGYTKSARAIRALSDEPAQGEQWRPIETAPYQTVILVSAFYEGSWKYHVYSIEHEYWQEEWDDYEPTHWMPLPAAPHD